MIFLIAKAKKTMILHTRWWQFGKNLQLKTRLNKQRIYKEQSNDF